MREKLINSKFLFVLFIFILVSGFAFGQVTITKTATEISCNTFEIETVIEADPPAKPIDAILILDYSGSMSWDDGSGRTPPLNTGWGNLKPAAQAFIDSLLGNGNPDNNRVGIVRFSSGVTTVNLTGNHSSISSTLNGWNSPSGSTNTAAAFNSARTMMATYGRTSPGCESYIHAIVAMSDGVPTTASGCSGCGSTPTLDNCCTLAAKAAALAATEGGLPPAGSTIIYTVGLFGFYQAYPATLTVARDVLDSNTNNFSSQYFETFSGADLSGFYAIIANQLLTAAKPLPGNHLIEDVLPVGFALVTGSESAISDAGTPGVPGDDFPKGSFTITPDAPNPGETEVFWTAANVSKETITIKYTIECIADPPAGHCGTVPSGNSSMMHYEDHDCQPQHVGVTIPDVFVTCIDVTIAVTPDQPTPACELPPAGYALDATVTTNSPITSYQWTSDSGGTFDTPTSEDTNWLPPAGFSGSATLTLSVVAESGCSSDDEEALVIVEIIPCDYDDLPASYDGGGDPYSVVREPALHIGASVTGEANGWDSPTGVGDADDGITISPFPEWVIGNSCTGLTENGTSNTITMDASTYCFTVKATNLTNNHAQLVAWIDWNVNGTFEDSERSVVTLDNSTGNVPAGSNNVDVVVYWTGVYQIEEETFTRMRITTDPVFKSPTSPEQTGATYDGETEGWLIEAGQLPVELTSFTAKATMAGVQLDWTTESEIENLGFVLERKTEDSGWTEIASYKTNDALLGQGTTSSATDYSFTDNLVQAGVTYEYRLVDVDYNGVVTYHSTREVDVVQAPLAKVEEFTVLPAYPNPFNPNTTIRYGLDTNSRVTIDIYDISGNLISTLVNTEQSQGWHSVEWNGTNSRGDQVPAGMYLSRISSGRNVKTNKLMLLK